MNTSTSTRGPDPGFLSHGKGEADPGFPGVHFAEDWERACRDDAELASLGARANVRFAVEAGAAAATLEFADGKLTGIRPGAAQAEFTMRAPAHIWAKFLAPLPPAPCHNVLAMKFRVPEFSVAGDEQKLLQHAHLVRRSLELARWVANGRDPAALRPEGPVAATAAGTVEPIAGHYASIEIEGQPHRIFFEQAGGGADLLFLHTAGSDTRQFHRLMNDAELLAQWRMTAFDLPWHGKSLPPQGGVPGEWRLNTDRYVACIDAVIRGLGLQRPVLLGSSMGGQICLEMAYRFADRLGGVIACEACDKITGREVPFAKHALYNQALAVPEWIYGLMSPTTPRARAIEIWWAYSQGGYGVFHGDIEFYAHDWDARERVTRIDTRRCPVIMLTGEYDYSCTPEMSRLTAARIPGAEFQTMKGLGHFPMTENPEGFLAYLKPALAKLREKWGQSNISGGHAGPAPTMSTSSDSMAAAARPELAGTGLLRVGVNLGNFLLVSKQAADGIGGIVPDLAQELARRLGVEAKLVLYPQAGPVADAAKAGAWDVAFIAAEPQRAGEIDFTEPYIEIEATYLVPAGSPIRSIAEVDRKGVRIAVASRSAYDLWLVRNIKEAELVRAEGIEGSYQLFVREKLDVLAGLKPRLLQDREKLPGARILEGRFTAVQQAIGTPRGRPAAAAYLREFAKDIKSSGLVARLIERHNVQGVSVA